MHSLFGARTTRRRFLHFSASVAAALTLGLAAAPASADASHEIVVVGDSVSAEYGLARGAGWVALLGQRLAAEKSPWSVDNASISGDTTSGGLARLPAVLKQRHPKIVVIELGGNDALRGTAMSETRKNLDAMVTLATGAGARVVIAGMMVPPNFGRKYQAEFAQMYADVATAHHAALVPFIFAGIADRPDADDWFQADRIHPLAKAHPIILDNVWAQLKPLLKA
ncbi:arylesterase [Scleromatobacter humisilvae]|uniref:Arylesterase n=1 Tax=Scleromatobacter humisilvae TaxID=2897159 RepID=A0A9X1YN52_9BURK|nr:arylesterase [Scleromatobacter humisilvae]MCK9687442.1 arylesterase [Scleromatobacter humisilvae]